MNREQAAQILRDAGISPDLNFFQMRSWQVAALLVEADLIKYRKPKNANGSRGRYFHAHVMRAYNRKG